MFAENLMAKIVCTETGEQESENPEIFKAQDDRVIQALNKVLNELLKLEVLITHNLKDWLAAPLLEYISILKSQKTKF